MRKRIITGLLVIVAVLGVLASAGAHMKQGEHDADLKSVLFGDEEVSLTHDEKSAFKAIANAAALCIDQFSPNEKSRWKEGVFNALQAELDNLGLPRLDVSFDDIDLNIATVNSEKNIVSNTHRQYTHKGWNCKKHPDMDFWQRRKDILRDTVNRVLFNPKPLFSWAPWLNDFFNVPSEQCDAFCGMVYYVHIIGDHIGGDTADNMKNIAPLIKYTSLSSPGVIVELQEQLQVLFASQKSTWTFQALEQELATLKTDAEKNCGIWGKIDTNEQREINKSHAKELLKILSENVHKLLKNEPFFKERFPRRS